jgi:hypothetical protein
MKYLPVLIVLVACGNPFPRIKSDKILFSKSNAPADSSKPVINTLFSSTIDPIIFEAAYFKDTKVKQGNLNFSFYTLEIGKIKIVSGKIIACDPIVMQDGIAFTQNFPTGHFPVQLAMAKLPNDERVAFSRILFSSNAVSKWEFALQPGQRPIPLKDTTIYCYGVDAGSGIFIDESANKIFNKKAESEWENVFVSKFEQYNYRGFIHDFEGYNLAAFSTGYGDGCYSTYIGFDEKGNVCRLLTDFGLIEWWKLAPGN